MTQAFARTAAVAAGATAALWHNVAWNDALEKPTPGVEPRSLVGGSSSSSSSSWARATLLINTDCTGAEAGHRALPAWRACVAGLRACLAPLSDPVRCFAVGTPLHTPPWKDEHHPPVQWEHSLCEPLASSHPPIRVTGLDPSQPRPPAPEDERQVPAAVIIGAQRIHPHSLMGAEGETAAWRLRHRTADPFRAPRRACAGRAFAQALRQRPAASSGRVQRGKRVCPCRPSLCRRTVCGRAPDVLT